MNIQEIKGLHGFIGFFTPLPFLMVALWGGVSWLTNRHPGKMFWRLVVVSHVVLVVQVIAGVVLVALGGRPDFLHYTYGLFPFGVQLFAYRWARRLEGLEWAPIAFAGLVNFGLVFRALMTGFES